ncbi:hypothetical protein DFH29DRAFT_1005064 [Suillus ampliporus]|nr:hypothetical protein DFH29DRAFT_1005064 [Suillus ampliporus]
MALIALSAAYTLLCSIVLQIEILFARFAGIGVGHRGPLRRESSDEEDTVEDGDAKEGDVQEGDVQEDDGESDGESDSDGEEDGSDDDDNLYRF